MTSSTPGGCFTVPRALVSCCGLSIAAVYGYMRAHSTSTGVCKASIPEIARGLSLHEMTVKRHIDQLVSRDLLKDLTAHLEHRPRVYCVLTPAWLGLGEGSAQPSKRELAEIIWKTLLAGLPRRAGRAVVNRTAAPCIPLSWDEITLRLYLPDRYQMNLFQRRLLPWVVEMLKRGYPGVQVELVTRAGLGQ